MPMKLRRGFTLLELLMIIAVIGILAAILLPALARAREAARRASCLSNLTELSVSMHLYADEHNQMLPWSGGNGNYRCFRRLYPDYVPDYRLFLCPSDSETSNLQDLWKAVLDAARKGEKPVMTDRFTSYVYLGMYAKAPIAVPPPERPLMRLPLMWDIGFKSGHGNMFNHVPGGSNVVYLDGSAEFVKYPSWEGDNLPVSPVGIEISDTGKYPFSSGDSSESDRFPGSGR